MTVEVTTIQNALKSVTDWEQVANAITVRLQQVFVRSLPRYKRGNFDSKVFIEGKTIN